MKKIAFISSFFNPIGFNKPVQNCEKFLRDTIGKTIPEEDFYFAQVKLANNKTIDEVLINKKRYLELVTDSVLWHKERCFNLLIDKFNLYHNYDYICYLDTDISFEKEIKISDNFQSLAFQPFNISIRYKNEKNIAYDKYLSWASDENGDKGLCWAFDAKLLKLAGGFFDYGIVGGSDTFMLNRMLGKKYYTGCEKLDIEINKYFSGIAIDKNNISYTINTVKHFYHGSITNRQYSERIKILIDNNYDPENDLIVEKSGLYRLRNKDFEKEIKSFFIKRKEDA